MLAERLTTAGFPTVEAIAGADTAALTSVSGVGPATAQRLLAAAASATGPVVDGTPRMSRVAKAVTGLRLAVPDLAKSKKHAAALVHSADRMTEWLPHLDRRKTRKRVVAETKRISSEAKKRTASSKAAKALRGHAAKIERAVRRAHS